MFQIGYSMNSQESSENGYKPVCMGLVETDKMHAIVIYQDASKKKEVRALVYLIEDNEVYDRPLSGFVVRSKHTMTRKSCSLAIRQLCRAIISGGISIYGARDTVVDYNKLLAEEYLGSEFIYNEAKRK
jgi:hypothetical protein